jgi:hypothetical protein
MNKAIILILVAVVATIGLGVLTLQLSVSTPTIDVSETQAVETYLRDNIPALSPVPAVLGGTWYVVSVTVDPDTNSGTVVYEDGHIQEERGFSYTLDGVGNISQLTIK